MERRRGATGAQIAIAISAKASVFGIELALSQFTLIGARHQPVLKVIHHMVERNQIVTLLVRDQLGYVRRQADLHSPG